MEQTQALHLLVREMRSRLKLTQEEFAARLGVTFISINRWENAKTRPSKMAIKLLKGLLIEMGDSGSDLLITYFDDQTLSNLDRKLF
ncbi:MAG: helix-turn-helix domain-containing protein [Thermosynechococcaceae cyanobacterium]